ncbi:S9 family peptidase [soil metagenome]
MLDSSPPALAAVSQAAGRAIHDAERHVSLTRVTAVVPSPDGRWLAVAAQRLDRKKAKFVSDLWRVELPAVNGAKAAKPRRLTSGERNDVAPAFRHDGALCFLSNRSSSDRDDGDDADKRMQVWLLPVGGGEPQPLTDEPLGVASFKLARAANVMLLVSSVLPGIAHDKQRETAAERAKTGSSARRFRSQPVRFWDSWLADSESGARQHLVVLHFDDDTIARRTDLTPDVGRELEVDPSFDIDAAGRVGVVTWETIGPDRIPDKALRVFDLDAGSSRLIAAEPRHEHEQPALSPDGLEVAVVHAQRLDGHVPVLRLATIDLTSGKRRLRATQWDAWPHLYGYTPDGRALVAGADQRCCTPVFRIDLASDAVETLCADASFANVGAFTGTDGQLAYAGIATSFLNPPQPFVSRGAGAPVQWLGALGPQAALPEVVIESLQTVSNDGTPVHSWFIKPANATGPLPLVMFIHGGPIGSSGNAWHWRWNPLLLIEHGYAVVLPDARGSTGYGYDFIDGIWNNRWGGQCYEDLMAVADACNARDDVDATRTAAMGGSFGGYMTNWIGSQTDRFSCLITHAPVYWMSGFSGVTDMPAYWYFQAGGTPFEGRADYDRFSPSSGVANWKSPVLIIHGERDYRCPISESLQLFEALQHHGVDSELMVFPDENHWILKPRNVVAWYEAVLAHLDRHLLKTG